MRTTHILRAVASIIAGIVVGAVLSIATDALLETIGVFPSFADQMNGTLLAWWLLLLATIYRSLYTIVSGYVGAIIAPNHPMRYATALGTIAVLANLAGLSILPDPSEAWYPILLALLAFPCARLGGRYAMQRKAKNGR